MGTNPSPSFSERYICYATTSAPAI
ncbi:hypothetical protein EYZ11_000803 [Aspergillus tanneri]|uniref:Uncharacterized protein n=1 Tax=Aspergillus tanneri TaxID=1220188 RepID=A0A4S3JWL3_9EURO|nr:hypothetical protein EYZ11_000803 [Aspergillus tanneri]